MMIFVIKNVGGKRCHTNCFAKKGKKFIMNTNQISCFLEAVKENNFTKAAAKLYLSQPNLSRSIAALEKELDVKLFIRHPDKSISLTQEGELYYNCFSRYRNELTEIHKKCLLFKNNP